MHCCTVCLLLGKVIGVCRYWQALSNNTAGTIQWEFCRYIKNCFYALIYMYTVVLPHPQHLCSLQQCIIIFCQSNKATMPIHIRTLVDSKRIATDWSFHSIYDVRWHYCQLFLSLSLYWDGLVISCVADLRHFSEEFSTRATYFQYMEKFQPLLHFSIIQLVTCFLSSIMGLIEGLDAH